MESRFEGVSNALWAITLGSLVLYCLVGSSQEFRSFAPLAITEAFFYVLTVVIGAAAGFVIRHDKTVLRLLLFALIFLVPVTVYGGALVVLWAEIGGWGLLDFFILQAGRRMIVYFAFVGLLGLLGVAVGIYLQETLS